VEQLVENSALNSAHGKRTINAVSYLEFAPNRNVPRKAIAAANLLTERLRTTRSNSSTAQHSTQHSTEPLSTNMQGKNARISKLPFQKLRIHTTFCWHRKTKLSKDYNAEVI
jgi:hypothetical protein